MVRQLLYSMVPQGQRGMFADMLGRTGAHMGMVWPNHFTRNAALWGGFGGFFVGAFMIQDPFFKFVADTVNPPPPEEDK